MATTTAPGSPRSRWALGASVAAVALVSGGWFLAIGPALGDAAALRTETTAVQDRNALLEVQLAGMARQFQELPALQSELATLRDQIPATGQLSDLLENLSDMAAVHGVTLLSVAPGTPVPMVPGVESTTTGAAAATTTGDGVEPTDVPVPDDATVVDPGVVDAAAGAAAMTAPLPGFVAVPVELTALGSTSDVLAFLERLQARSTRLMLVTALNGTGQEDAEAAGARPATTAGDVEMRISGYVYVLEDDAAPVATAPEGGELPTSGSPRFATG
jgi:hypothetical protein